MREIGAYLLRHYTVAAFVALLAVLLPFFSVPVGWVAALVIAYITLCRGAKAGLYILTAAMLPLVILVFKGDWGLGLLSIFAGNVLIWLFAVVLRRTESWAMVAQTAAVVGIVVIAIVHIHMPDIHQWWLTKFSSLLPQFTKQMGLGISAQQMHSMVLIVAKIATGMQVVLVFLRGLFYLFFARMWQAYMFNSGGLKRESYQIRMGKIYSIVMILFCIAIVAGSNFAWDCLPVILLPFFLAGLSLIHAIAARHKNGFVAVIAMYILLFFLFPYVAGLLVLAAFVDSWYDFRIRYQLSQLKE